MVVVSKAIFVVLAISGIAMTGVGAAGILENAIAVHEDRYMNQLTPEQSMKGQQTALDQLRFNQEKWIAKHGAVQTADDIEDDDPSLEDLFGP